MPHVLNLMPGDWVEVRSADEILATLDADGCLESLPFMPEMLAFCGKRFRVHKRADKTCDTIGPWTLRRMLGTVHLALLRCNGASHGGCHSRCLFFWKEAWLKRVAPGEVAPSSSAKEQENGSFVSRAAGGPDRNGQGSRPDVPSGTGVMHATISNLHQLEQTARRPTPPGASGAYYRCQSTELQRASSCLRWWEPRQYWRDMRSNSVSLFDVLRGLSYSILNRVLKALKRPTYPKVVGPRTRTPAQDLNLQPG